MHTITWLHLSDLHFQKNDEYNRGVVLDALWKDISERVNCINSDLGKLDFICVTGDIAYHGKTEEYELA
nr:calcineurin-like phosphoesterase [bacterium]